jgi:sugar lactone lactonase YvrE
VVRAGVALGAIVVAACGRIGFDSATTTGDAGVDAQFPGTLDLVAGAPGGFGFVDGDPAASRFHVPAGIAIDGAGRIYVGDIRNHVIRVIDASGVHTFAGAPGIAGFADGTASAARFDRPHGIAVDAAGNVYVADLRNCAIRKITPAGVVTTVAGNGTFGSADGTGAAASFANPSDVTVDPAGNVYVADSYNCTIRQITPAGVVSTIGGQAGQCAAVVNGSASVSRFDFPKGVTYAAGALWVTDRNNKAVRRWDGATWTTAASGLGYPRAVAVDGAGTIYAADEDVVRRYTGATWVTVAGIDNTCGYADGTGTAAAFCELRGIALDASGNFVVTDSRNGMIRRITPSGVVSTIAGSSLPHPEHIDGDTASARLYHPLGLAIGGDTAILTEGTFYGIHEPDTIRTVALPQQNVTTVAGMYNVRGSTDGTGAGALFYWPAGIAVDAQGNAVVADLQNCTLRRVTPAGVVTTIAGAALTCGAADGAVATARLTDPTAVAIDAAGTIYFTDNPSGGLVRKLAAGTVATIAGLADTPGYVDARGNAARFRAPLALAVDAQGMLYVADTGNHAIRKVAADGTVTTLAGAPPGAADPAGVVDGTGTAARFNHPQAITVDPAGNVFVCDESGTIRRISPSGDVVTVAGVAGVRRVVTGPLPGGLSGCTALSAVGIGDVYVIDSVENVLLRLRLN